MPRFDWIVDYKSKRIVGRSLRKWTIFQHINDFVRKQMMAPLSMNKWLIFFFYTVGSMEIRWINGKPRFYDCLTFSTKVIKTQAKNALDFEQSLFIFGHKFG